MARWILVRLPSDLPREVLVMAGVAFCVALGFGVVAPAIPLFATQFGVDATAAGAVVSAFALMRLVSGLGAGKLVDRVGERTGLVIGLAVVAVSSLLAGLAQSYPQLVVLRGVGGIGSAVFGVAAVGLVLRVAPRTVRARSMGVYRSGFIVGGIVGPAVGGAVLGFSLRAPFFLYAATLVASGTVALVFLAGRRLPRRDEAAPGPDATTDPRAEPEPAAEKRALEPTLRTVVRTREYQAALVANLAVGLSVFGLRSTVVPLLIVQGLGATPSWVGWAFLVSSLIQTATMLPAGRLADTMGRRPALLLGSAVTTVGLLLLGVGGSLLLAMIAMAVFGAGEAFFGTAPGALVGDVAGSRSGSVVAVFNMASDLGAVVGPVLAGLLVDEGSFAAAFGLGAAAVAMAGLFGLRIPRRSRLASG